MLDFARCMATGSPPPDGSPLPQGEIRGSYVTADANALLEVLVDNEDYVENVLKAKELSEDVSLKIDVNVRNVLQAFGNLLPIAEAQCDSSFACGEKEIGLLDAMHKLIVENSPDDLLGQPKENCRLVRMFIEMEERFMQACLGGNKFQLSEYMMANEDGESSLHSGMKRLAIAAAADADADADARRKTVGTLYNLRTLANVAEVSEEDRLVRVKKRGMIVKKDRNGLAASLKNHE